eukprot:539125-Rhodomonas_salina.1
MTDSQRHLPGYKAPTHRSMARGRNLGSEHATVGSQVRRSREHHMKLRRGSKKKAARAKRAYASEIHCTRGVPGYWGNRTSLDEWQFCVYPGYPGTRAIPTQASKPQHLSGPFKIPSAHVRTGVYNYDRQECQVPVQPLRSSSTDKNACFGGVTLLVVVLVLTGAVAEKAGYIRPSLKFAPEVSSGTARGGSGRPG